MPGRTTFQAHQIVNEQLIFEKSKERDIIKNKLCTENGIAILYYARECHSGSVFDLITSKNELLNKILNK